MSAFGGKADIGAGYQDVCSLSEMGPGLAMNAADASFRG
jgi:hypothetical protein